MNADINYEYIDGQSSDGNSALYSAFNSLLSNVVMPSSGGGTLGSDDYLALQSSIQQETNNRIAQDASLSTRINNEVTRATNAEANLQTQVTQNSNDIDVLDARSLQGVFDTNPSDLNLQNSGRFIYIDDLDQTATSKQVTNKAYVDENYTNLLDIVNGQSLDDIQFRTPLKADLDLTYSNFKTILGTVDVKTQINMINDSKIILRDLETGAQIQDQEPVPWNLVNQITTGLDSDIQAEITRAQNSETNLQNQINNKMEANIPLSSINRPNASLNLDNQKIINLAPATLSTDAINKGQLDSVQTTLQSNIDGKYANTVTLNNIQKATGALDLNGNDIVGAATIYTNAFDATTITANNIFCSNARASALTGDAYQTENNVIGKINTLDVKLTGQIDNEQTRAETEEGRLEGLINNKMDVATKLNQIPIATDQVNLNNNRIINLFDPASLQDAATKNYVDSSISSAISGGTTTNQTLQQIQTANPGNLDMLSTNRLILRSNMNNESIENLPLANEAISYQFAFSKTTQLEASLQTEVENRVSGDQALDVKIENLQNQLNYVPVDPELSAVTKMIARENDVQVNDVLNMNTNKIINLANATLSSDAVNKSQLDLKADQVTTYTKTETDNLLNAKVNTATLVNYSTTTQMNTALDLKANQATTYTKTETDNLLNAKVNTSTTLNSLTAPTGSLNMNSQKITGLANGTLSTDAVTKAQLDAISAGTGIGTNTLQTIQNTNPISANLDLGSYGVSTTQSQFGSSDLVTKSYVTSVIPQSSAFEYLSLFSVNVFPALNGYFGNSNWNIRRQQTNTLISYDTNTGMFTLQPGTYTMGVGYASNNVQTCNVTAFNDVTGNRLCQDVLGITATSVVYDVWYSEVKYYSAGGWQFKNSPITFTINTAVRVKFQLTNQTFTNNVLYYVNVQTAMPNAVSFSTASNDINMNNFYLNNLPNPVLNQQPVTLAYFNANLAAASSTFNSNINMQNLYKVTNLANGSLSSDSCAYGQLTSAISGLSSTYMPLTYRLDQITVPTASLNFNNQRITNLGNPQANGDAVNVLHLNTNFYPITGSVQRIRLNANTGSLIAQFPTSTTYTISRQSQTGNYTILSAADHSLEQSHDSITRYGFTSGATLKKLTDTAEYQTRPLWLSSSTSVSRDARLYVSRPTGATQSRLVVFEDAGVGGSYNDAGLYANCYSEFNRNVQINGNFQAVSYSILGTWLGGQPSQAKLLVANNNSTDQLSIECEGHIYSNGNVYADNFITVVPVSMREYKKEITAVYNEDLHDVEMVFFKYDHKKLERDAFPALDRLPDENQIQTGFCLDNVPSRYWRQINQQFSTIENINQLKDELLGFLMQSNRVKSQQITELQSKCSDYEQRLRQLEAVVFGTQN